MNKMHIVEFPGELSNFELMSWLSPEIVNRHS